MSNNGFFAQYKDQLILHIIILVWGFTGILGKLITIPSTAIVWYRMAIAFVALAIYLLIWKRERLIASRKQITKYILTGFVVAGHWFFFFEALKVSNVSVTLATLASATLFTSVLEPFFYKRKIIWYEMLFGLFVIGGLLMIFNFETEYKLGILYALISAFLASLFTTLNGTYINKKEWSRTISLYEMLGGVIGISLFYSFSGEWSAMTQLPNLMDVFYLLILGVVCTALAFVISVEVMKTLSPFTVSISINMEPVYSIFLALIFFGESEKMSVGFYLGAVLIMATILLNAFIKTRMKKKAKPATLHAEAPQ